jgi:hypothetical protein
MYKKAFARLVIIYTLGRPPFASPDNIIIYAESDETSLEDGVIRSSTLIFSFHYVYMGASECIKGTLLLSPPLYLLS